MDSGYTLTVSNGQKFWIERWIKWDPGFEWDFGGPNASYKTFDIRANTSPNGSQNRLLLTVWGDGRTSGATTGQPWFSIYPNSTGSGGTGNEVWRPNVDGQTGFVFTGGVEYHCIVEITSASGLNGGFRMWVNGDLIRELSPSWVNRA